MKIQVALLIMLLQATLLFAQAPASRVAATNTVRLKSYVVPQIIDPKAVFVKDAKAHVPIDLGGLSAGQFRVLTSDGNRWNVATNALKYSASSTNIVVPTNRQYIMLENLDKGAIPKASLSAKGIRLPVHLGVAESTTPASAKSEIIGGTLFLQPTRVPLPWRSNLQAYATDLEIGWDLEDKRGTITLDHPVMIQFHTTNAEVRPTFVKIERTGPEGYTNVTVLCERHDLEASVTAHGTVLDESCVLPVVAKLNDLKITASPKKVAGYGLGTATLTVRRLAEDNTDLAERSDRPVTLATVRGNLPSTLTIPADKSSAEIELRSSGLGLITITASANGLPLKEERLEFIFPLGLIIWACLGGCLGGVCRSFKGAKRGQNWLRKNCLRGCALGLLAAAFVFAGLITRILPDSLIGTELGAFVCAGFFGYGGTALLDKYLKPLRKGV